MKRKRRKLTAEYKHEVAWMVKDDRVRAGDVCLDQDFGEMVARPRIDQLKAERVCDSGEGA